MCDAIDADYFQRQCYYLVFLAAHRMTSVTTATGSAAPLLARQPPLMLGAHTLDAALCSLSRQLRTS